MTTESKPRALVVGLGISGISTAIQLQLNGWTPVIVERAPTRRSGGYFVGLFGAGKYSAERLGILDRLHNRIGDGVRTYQIDRQGRRRPGIGFADVPGEPWMMLRGDVEAAAFAELDPQTEIRYATGPTAIVQDGDQVEVTLRSTATGQTTTERFDLVVGADGLRSTVRRLVFGPDVEHLHRLNYMIAAYELPGELPGLARGEGATLAEPGRVVLGLPVR
jgi:2-polyprenyl-6-methoxyphenol hydroxylase-like FAD-dependent oxidoreductase